MTNTYTTSATYTKTNVKYVASKVIADLRGLSAYYGQPSDSKIWDFYEELVELLADGYVASVEYGFKRNEKRVVSLYYEARADGSLTDGRSGGVFARADISGASWFSYLVYSNKWDSLSPAVQQQVKDRIPIKRTHGQAPGDGNGYWSTDRTYSSQGLGVQRRTFRPTR